MISQCSPKIDELIGPQSIVYKQVIAKAARKGLQHHDAEDVAQDVAIHLINLSRKRPEKMHGVPTVLSIAANCISTFHRKQQRKSHQLTSRQEIDKVPARNSRSEFVMPTAEELNAALMQFKKPSRQIFFRYLVQREGESEIAKSMGMTTSAIRARIYRLQRRSSRSNRVA